MQFVSSQGEPVAAASLNASNSAENFDQVTTSRRVGDGTTSVFPEGKSPSVSTILDTGGMPPTMPEKTGSELELDQYVPDTRMDYSQRTGPLDMRSSYQIGNRGPRTVPSPDGPLLNMPFMDAVNTDAIVGVNPQLMDVLHNQFASIADAFRVQRNWTTTELRQVHNQMYQVGEAMENLHGRLNEVSS